VPELITGGHGDPADRGDSDPEVAAALNAFAAGQGSEHAALSALAGTRLLVPVVAMLAEATNGVQGTAENAAEPGRLRREKVSEMALPTLVGNDGRRAILAFTSLRSLTAWRPDARPVPVPARQAWQAGAQEASAVVIDVAGPVPLAVDGARLAALADGRPPPPPHEDPDVRALADAAMTGEPLIAGFALLPGEDGSDLTIQVMLAHGHGPGQAPARAAIQRAVGRIAAAGGGRVRRGITVTASMADRPGDAAGPGITAAPEGGAAGGMPPATSGGQGAEAGGP
jgi:SseB protein N-terminal domain